ncbi:AGE family epimerase/isomerase [Halobaculum magnesiiphilum]|uniref:AGE family epimerase/isomerase n=1 Tax=Halobaculum magnesiiphilum TaxID=1017351 RepID=A0A8T8WAS5_9EURY|nr:AGE family epimerase/isomerase [Halobaculum magnesiiphilum]QZP36935.1 AGE family epimerase/isomerase [Halobaculum magnesiiphilum]
MINSPSNANRGRLLATLRVQYPDALAERGFRLLHPVSGDPYTDHRRHLVATCRSIANFAIGAVADGPDWCLDAAEHGLAFLRQAHRTDDGDGYHLVVGKDGEPLNRTRSAYGHAFVLLAFARATAADIDGAEDDLVATHELLEDRFRDGAGMVRSDCAPDWTEQEEYRGQNANMHACEAYLAAYEATGETRYLDRARHIAYTITIALARETDGLLWEHYTDDWDHDFGYNEDEPRHQFRPPGYQPGHHVEWAKFLALLDRYDEGTDAGENDEYVPDGGWYARALELFETAVDNGWTGTGFVYTHEKYGRPIVSDQYGWALAEAIGASAALAERAAEYGDLHTVDHLQELNHRFLACTDSYRGPAGLWYEKRLLANDGGDLIAPDPPGVEPDYHPVSAFYECWRSAHDPQPDD